MSGGFSNKRSSGSTELTADELLWVQTGESGILLLAVQGSAPAHTANVGKLYVLESDNYLYYKDENGTVYNLTSGGASVETPTGTVNGSNAIFGVTGTAKLVVTETGNYANGFGFTQAGNDITLDIPPALFIYYFT